MEVDQGSDQKFAIYKSLITNSNISMVTYHSSQSFPRQEHPITVNDPVYCLAILEILEICSLYHRQTKPPYFFLKNQPKMYLIYTAFTIVKQNLHTSFWKIN